MSVLIDREKCIGCGLCVKDCPNACLTMNEGRACVVTAMRSAQGMR